LFSLLPAVIITDEVRFQGILFAAITILHLWLTPYMMRVIIILHTRVSEHLQALRAQFATIPLTTLCKKEGEGHEFDPKGFQVVEFKQDPPLTDAPFTVLRNNNSKDSHDKNDKQDGIEIDSTVAPTGMTTNPIASNPGISSHNEEAAAAAASTADTTLSRLPMITEVDNKEDGGTNSSYMDLTNSKRSRTKMVLSFKKKRARELGKLEAVVIKIRITLCVWAILGILAPILSGIGAFALIQSSKSLSDIRNEAYQDNVWNPFASATTLVILLFNGLVLWNFGGPWSLAPRI